MFGLLAQKLFLSKPTYFYLALSGPPLLFNMPLSFTVLRRATQLLLLVEEALTINGK
jgi:hypothetical protein